MAANTYLSIVLNERPPEAFPVPGRTFQEKISPVPGKDDLQDGQVLVENLYLSLDPAMLGWMRDEPSYLPPVKLGGVMRGYSVSRVIVSKSQKFKTGDFVAGFTGWTELAIQSDEEVTPVPPGIRPVDVVGVFGISGLTAYFGVTRIADPKEGDLVVVSSAAGATGSVVAQLCKAMGCRVIGLAGSEDKVRWLKEHFGLDAALNYKDPAFQEQFEKATEAGIDIYWDNVRGDILDLALKQSKVHARFVMCGGTSQYGRKEGEQAYKNFKVITGRRIRMQGLLLMDYMTEISKGIQELGVFVAEGKVKTDYTIVKGGLKAAEDGLMGMFAGKNQGKTMVEIKEA